VDTCMTDNQVATVQVQELDLRNDRPKVVAGDSLYGNALFLKVLLTVKTIVALVRLRSNQVFYEKPVPRPAGSRGAPTKHGAKFKLSEPSRPADRSESFLLGKQTVHLQAWLHLHFKKLSTIDGLVLRVDFLRPDGTSRYKRPMWLFWTGPQDIALQDICRMYLWRFAIEHLFRFLKQHMGLNANQSTDLVSTGNWMWYCALAYWQLLLMRDEVKAQIPAWNPQAAKTDTKRLTPGMVQRGALGYLLGLGTPACVPRNAGKGKGRAIGFQPSPRTRYSIIKKGKSPPNLASTGT